MYVKEFRGPSHLAPPAGRGRDLRVCARIPGEGQRRVFQLRPVQPPEGPSPRPSPRKRGEGELCGSDPTNARDAGRGSAAVMLFELGGNHHLRLKAHAAEPHLVDLSVAPANAPDRLAVVSEPAGEADSTAIGAGYRNFARIHERIRERGGADHHLPAHRHEIDGNPTSPPSTRPI